MRLATRSSGRRQLILGLPPEHASKATFSLTLESWQQPGPDSLLLLLLSYVLPSFTNPNFNERALKMKFKKWYTIRWGEGFNYFFLIVI